MLEDGVDVALVRGGHAGYVDALEPNRALGGLFEARNHAQGGGLSAAGGAEHGEELARTDREVGVSDGDVVLEALDDVIDFDDRRAAGAPGSGVSGGSAGWRWRRCRSGPVLLRPRADELRPVDSAPKRLRICVLFATDSATKYEFFDGIARTAPPVWGHGFRLNGSTGPGGWRPSMGRIVTPFQVVVSPRAITSRWIWLVPSKIWVILASRMKRSAR